MTRLDWDRARQREATRPRREAKFRPGPKWRWQPPTEPQLRALDRLHVRLYGTHYERPRGLTRSAASDLIECWIARVGGQPPPAHSTGSDPEDFRLSMGYEEHYVFESPDDPDTTLWRYMDLPRLVSLLDREALFFSRVDCLGDPWEASRASESLLRRLGDRDPVAREIADDSA